MQQPYATIASNDDTFYAGLAPTHAKICKDMQSFTAKSRHTVLILAV